MELKAKQDYLFTEILEANYDPEVFQEFMERQRGVNLDSYSMQELVQVVQQFKGKARPETQLQELQEQPVKPEVLPPASEAKDEAEKGGEGKSGSFNTSTKVLHQFLRKEELPQLYRRVHQQGQRVQVRIRSYSKESDESLFGSTYVVYLLETGAWSVRRRFKDFEWLHSRLALMYPGLPVPPIPRKTALRSFEDRHLEERMICFERFANRLLQIPEVCSDPVLEQFLSVAPQQQWTTCRDRFEIRLSNQGTKITTLKGESLINLAEFAVSPADTQSLAASLEVTRTLNGLLGGFQKALRTAAQLAFELAARLGEAHGQLAGTRGREVVELMGEFVSELGYRLDGESFFVKGNLEDYWAYEEKYQENLLANLARANKENLDLLTRAKHLQHADLDLDDAPRRRPLAEYLLAKEQYRIRLSFTLEELRRHREQDLGVVAREWAAAVEQYVGGIKELMLSGADHLTKALCVCEGRQLREVEYLATRQRGKDALLPREAEH